MTRLDHRGLTRRVRVAQLLLLAIVVGGTIHVTDAVVGGGLFADPTRVTVELPEAAGLHERSTVTYRGQQIGTVSEVRLEGDGVVAVLEIDEDVPVPRDSEFAVRNLSAVGEQYVDVRPRSDGGPFLADGATVAAADTSTPRPTHELVADTQHLLGRIDLADLRTIARESDAALGDGAVDLRATSVELEEAFALLDDLEPDLVRLLERGQVPLRTGVDLEDELRGSARDLALVARVLRDGDPDLRRVIDRGAELTPMLATTWDRLAALAEPLLQVAEPLMAMSEAHLPGLHHWLDWVPRQADAMAGSTRDGTGHVLLVPKSLKNCVYTEDQRTPGELDPVEPDLDRHCTDGPPGTQGRGSQNVPRP